MGRTAALKKQRRAEKERHKKQQLALVNRLNPLLGHITRRMLYARFDQLNFIERINTRTFQGRYKEYAKRQCNHS